MNHLRSPRNNSGFTLVEILLAMMLMGILAIGLSSTLLGITRSQKKSESNANASEISKMIQQAFAGKNKKVDDACTATMQLRSTPRFTTRDGKTDVRLIMTPLPDLLEGTDITVGPQKFTVSKLYLSDNARIDSLSTGSTNTYLSNLYIETSQGLLDLSASRRRSLGTISVTIENGVMTNCNAKAMTMSSQYFCGNVNGMIWNEQMQRCLQYAEPMAGSNEINCPPGTWRRGDDLCVPVASDCGARRVARGFKKGLMSSCLEAPIGPSKGLTATGTQPVIPPAVPSQTAASAPTPPAPPANPYVAPVVTQNVTAPAPPATPPQSCVNGTTMNETSYSLCQDGGFPCDLTGVTSVGANCVVQENKNYTTPNLATTPPSVAPPNNNTCMCNNSRILHNEYCMYCLNNVSAGYGIKQYSYGVSRCDNGVLVPETAPAMENTGINCNNTYKRAVRSPVGRYNQIP